MNDRLITHKNFPSKHVPARNITVWLPESYGKQRQQRYEVLYMHDGQNVFFGKHSGSGEDWGLIEAQEMLLAQNSVPEIILVAIWCNDQRWQEYLPERPFATPLGRGILPKLNATMGGPPYSDNYLRFLVYEVKPYIDSHYRTLSERDHTHIMGSSMGGLISLYALVEYPGLFAGAGCVSTHWPAVAGVMVAYLRDHLPPAGRHRLYFDYGTATLDAAYEPFQLEIDQLLSDKGYTVDQDWVTRKFEGASHSETAWRERVYIPLSFLLG